MRKNILFIIGWLIITIIPVTLFAQTRALTGIVTASNNSPIAGATIAVKNSSLAVPSDANGRFTINVPDNAVVIISAIGYKTQTITITGNYNLKVTLDEDVSNLDEVVVTGLSTSVKRKNLANSVAVIGHAELNGTAPAQTFDAALEGKIPGANINANSGSPGGGISVKLRGVTSVYGNTQPLYVIDGVEADNSITSGGLNAVTAAAIVPHSGQRSGVARRS